MAQGRHRPIAAELRRLAERLESYRKRPGRPRRLPDGIWSAAAGLAQEHGVSGVARALRLDYYALKRRVSATVAPSADEVSRKFVEVCVGKVGRERGCTLELEDRTGRRMAVQVADRKGLDLDTSYGVRKSCATALSRSSLSTYSSVKTIAPLLAPSRAVCRALTNSSSGRR